MPRAGGVHGHHYHGHGGGGFLPETLATSTYSVNYLGTSQANLQELQEASHGILSQSKTSLHASQLFGSRKLVAEQAADVQSRILEGDIFGVQGRVTPTLALTAFLIVIGGSTPHGYNTGVINTPEKFIKEFVNNSFSSHFGSTPSHGTLSLLWTIAVSIYLFGGMVGAFCAGWLANVLGRKKAVLTLHLCGFLAVAMFFISKYINSFELFIIGRFIIGYGSGANFCLVPMYLAEISPCNIRGAMGVLHQLGLTVGIALSQICGLSFFLGNAENWNVLLSVTGLFSLISLIFLPFFPDSPRFLFVNKQDEAAAVAALKKFRGEDDVSADIFEMRNELKVTELEPPWSLQMLFRARPLRLPLFIVAGLALCQQLSGINVVFFYSTIIYRGAGISDEYNQYATLAVGIINVLMTVISVPLMERLGRRFLLLSGMLLMLITMAGIIICLKLAYLQLGWLSYLSVASMIFYVIGFAIGLGSIPNFIGSEVFRQGPRPSAMAVGGVLNWLGNFSVALTFPHLENLMGAWSFLIFMSCVTFFGVFIYKKLPETKNKSFHQIQQELGVDQEAVNAMVASSTAATGNEESAVGVTPDPAANTVISNGIDPVQTHTERKYRKHATNESRAAHVSEARSSHENSNDESNEENIELLGKDKGHNQTNGQAPVEFT